MPLRRYGRAEKPVLVSPMSPEKAGASDSPASGLSAHAFAVPPGSSASSDMTFVGDWDFSSSTTSQKAIELPAPKTEQAAAQAAGASSSMKGAGGVSGSPRKSKKQAAVLEEEGEKEVVVSSTFLGDHGQARAKVDDIEFVLGGLKPSQSQEVRTTSYVALARMCFDQEILALLRAHSLLDKLLDLISGATETPGATSLAAALVLLLLAQDEANTVMQSEGVARAMITCMKQGLGSAECGSGQERETKEVPKFKYRRLGDEARARQQSADKVLQVCMEAKEALKLPEELGEEAMRRLVSHEHLMVLASAGLAHRAAAFRENFRLAGGVRVSCGRANESLQVASLSEGEHMWRLERDLRLLEGITHMSEANQQAVLDDQPTMIAALVTLVGRLTAEFAHGEANVAAKKRGKAGSKGKKAAAERVKAGSGPGSQSEGSERYASCRLAALRVLVNLTNHSARGAAHFGDARGVAVLFGMLITSNGSGETEDFDALTLGLGVLINVLESNRTNRDELAAAKTASGETALAFLARVFLSRTGATQGRIDLRIIAVDHLVVAAYASVLIGFAVEDRPGAADEVEAALGKTPLAALVRVLDYFIQCHEEAERGRGSNDFLAALASVLQSLNNLVERRSK